MKKALKNHHLIQFFQHFLRNPKAVGALSQFSKVVAKHLLAPFLAASSTEGRAILEVGAGMGNISQLLQKKIGPYDRLDIIELDAKCCDHLRGVFQDDPRIQIHEGSILDWIPEVEYDFIVSTLPFNSFSPDFVRNILEKYQSISSPKASLTYVEYIGLHQLSFILSRPRVRKRLLERRTVLRSFQKKYCVHKRNIFLNFLPCHIYHLSWQNETVEHK